MKVLLLMWSTRPPPPAVMGHLAHLLLSSGELISSAQLSGRPGPAPFIAAYWLVDCDSLERALQIAARIPCHAVEVRPVLRMPGEEM